MRWYQNVFTKSAHPGIVSGMKARCIRIGLLLNIFYLALIENRNPLKAFRVFKTIRNRRKKIHDLPRISRFVRGNGKYYWSENIPGWPSKNLNTFIKGELIRSNGASASAPPLQTLIFGITSRCGLQCSHCYDWDNLQSGEHLALADLLAIMEKLKNSGIPHIQFSGGEPLARFEDLLILIGMAKPTLECWILTSGFGLTFDKALKLKQAGLTGANISLDHWNESAHNTFRNNDKSFHWVHEAVKNCRKAGIVVCLSLCATREFVNEENLYKYLDLAKQWGAGLIRILEPRLTGRFKNSDNMLPGADQIVLLQKFYQQTNLYLRYNHYPIVMYPGYHQRKTGCFGAGNRYIYIDSKGDIHACPFCQGAVGNALTHPLQKAINSLKKNSCHEFNLNIGD